MSSKNSGLLSRESATMNRNDSRPVIGQASPVILRGTGICKSYRTEAETLPVLCGVDLAVHEGEFSAIIGQSGSGKSTLLHLLGTLDKPDSGEIHFRGKRIDNLNHRDRDRFRNHEIGLIFQFYHLLPELTVLENVLVPYMIRLGVISYFRQRKALHERARHLLEMVGLSHRLRHRPSQLSGGERQRTAIARSLIANPSLLLADEPTGNLDSKSGGEVLDILAQLGENEKLTIVMVTHDDAIAQQADSTIRLVEGVVESQQSRRIA